MLTSNAICAEDIYTVLGPEFSDLEGRTAIVEKVLNRLRSSGYAWRSTLWGSWNWSNVVEIWKFEGNHVDMDVWRKSAVRAVTIQMD